ncbi:MAG: hypothetical protein R3A10_01075 [Caldilineaceae bacterium]
MRSARRTTPWSTRRCSPGASGRAEPAPLIIGFFLFPIAHTRWGDAYDLRWRGLDPPCA